jgi:hypothetical protein
LIAPYRLESHLVLEVDKLITPFSQGVVLHITHIPFDNPFEFGIATFAGDRL